MSFLEKFLFRSSVHFWGVVCLLLNCIKCLYTLEIEPLSDASFTNIFPQSIGCLLTLFMVSVAVQKLVCLIGAHLFVGFWFFFDFAFISIALGD